MMIRLPKLFFDDHWERELPTPVIIKETARHYFVSADDPAIPELLDDAEYYTDPYGPDAPWLKRSALATANAIRSALPHARGGAA